MNRGVGDRVAPLRGTPILVVDRSGSARWHGVRNERLDGPKLGLGQSSVLALRPLQARIDLLERSRAREFADYLTGFIGHYLRKCLIVIDQPRRERQVKGSRRSRSGGSGDAPSGTTQPAPSDKTWAVGTACATNALKFLGLAQVRLASSPNDRFRFLESSLSGAAPVSSPTIRRGSFATFSVSASSSTDHRVLRTTVLRRHGREGHALGIHPPWRAVRQDLSVRHGVCEECLEGLGFGPCSLRVWAQLSKQVGRTALGATLGE